MAKELHGDSKGAEDPKRKPDPPEKREEDEEAALDKTLADSFPASDPPLSIPDPDEDKENAA